MGPRPRLNSKAIGLAIDSGIATLEFVQEFLTECQLSKSEYMYMYVYCTCMRVCVRASVPVNFHYVLLDTDKV